MQPTRPENLSPYAERCLRAVATAGLGHRISLGGAVGLQHFLEYRATHDVDAWWAVSASEDERARVAQVVEQALAADGEVRTRRWGEVVSIELKIAGKKVFSFQVAERSAQLQPTTLVPWVDIALDSFEDLVASKMVALVERGAPRDFLDIFTLCRAGLVTTHGCWRLWKERQSRAEQDTGEARARLAVETHLTRVALHRPLEQITDAVARERAQELRLWVRTELMNALLD